MYNTILLTELGHSCIDELSAIITSKSMSLQARLLFKHGHNVVYGRFSFIFII